MFDRNNSGVISYSELKSTLGNGVEDDTELQAMFKQVDVNGDGKLSFEEFKEMMKEFAVKCTTCEKSKNGNHGDHASHDEV